MGNNCVPRTKAKKNKTFKQIPEAPTSHEPDSAQIVESRTANVQIVEKMTPKSEQNISFELGKKEEVSDPNDGSETRSVKVELTLKDADNKVKVDDNTLQRIASLDILEMNGMDEINDSLLHLRIDESLTRFERKMSIRSLHSTNSDDSENTIIIRESRFSPTDSVNVSKAGPESDPKLDFVRIESLEVLDFSSNEVAVDSQAENLDAKENSNVAANTFHHMETEKLVEVSTESEVNSSSPKKDSQSEVEYQAERKVEIDTSASPSVKALLQRFSSPTVVSTSRSIQSEKEKQQRLDQVKNETAYRHDHPVKKLDFSEPSTRELESEKERRHRLSQVRRETSERGEGNIKQIKEFIETMEDIHEQCETYRDF